MMEFGLVGSRNGLIFFFCYPAEQQINSVQWCVFLLYCGPVSVPPQVKVFGRYPKVSGIWLAKSWSR